MSMLALAFALPLTACSGANTNTNANTGAPNNMTTEAVRADMSREVKSVESVMENYSKQITAKNLSAMETYVFTEGEDFTIFEGKGKNIGWADYRDNHLAPELANEDLVFTKYDFTNFKTFVGGNVAAITFSIDAAYNYKGKETSHMGQGTAILKKVDGTWKITHMQT